MFEVEEQKRAIIVITGAAGGIGSAIARRFARDNEAVIQLFDHNDAAERIAALCSEIAATRKGSGLCAYGCNDVTDESDVFRTAQDLTKRYSSIGVLVNVAGVVRNACPLVGTQDGGKNEETRDALDLGRLARDFSFIMGVNLLGTLLWSRAVLPSMWKNGFGRIVNVASMAGIRGEVGMEIYSMSKAGVVHLTKMLARYAPQGGKYDITVNCVAPGIVEGTPMAAQLTDTVKGVYRHSNPQRRLTQVEEVADAIHWLALAAPRSVNGVVLPIDGGHTTP